MRKLIIIDKKIGLLDEKNILRNVTSKKILIYDLHLDKNKDFYKKNKILKNILKNNIFSNRNFLKIKKIFEKKIKDFLKKNPDFIEYKFTELNYSDFWWKILLKVYVINIFCREKNIQEVQIIEKFKSDLSSALSAQKNFFYFKRSSYFINLLKYKIFFKKVYISNFFKEIISYIFSINNKNNKNNNENKKNFIYSGFPNGWIFSKKPYNRFFGGKIADNNFYLFSLTRSNQYILDFNITYLDRLKIIDNYILLEENSTIKNIFFNYFIKNKNKKKIFHKLNKVFKNNFISSLLAQAIIDIEIPKNNVLIDNLKKFNNSNKVKKIIHSIPEFVDGRIINRVFNEKKIKTFGIQHSSLGILQYSRFITMIKLISKINKKYLPKNLLVENLFIKKKFSNIFSNTKIIGNLRINKRMKYNKINNKNIHYIAEMHNINLLSDRIIKIKNNFKDKNLFIRLHPGKKKIQKKIVSRISGFNKNIFLDENKDLTQSIFKIKPGLVFTSSPTVYRELIINNIRVVLIDDMNFFTNYPIDIKYNKITKTSKFKNADYKKKTHNLTTKIFGNVAENRIYNIFNEK